MKNSVYTSSTVDFNGLVLLNILGTIWAQQPNSDLVCFTPNKTGRISSITPPEPGQTFVCLHSVASTVWGLLENGDVYIRQGVTMHYPQGHRWVKLGLVQLGRGIRNRNTHFER